MINPYDLSSLTGIFLIKELLFLQKVAVGTETEKEFEKEIIIDLICQSKEFDFKPNKHCLGITSNEIIEYMDLLRKFKKLKPDQIKTLREYLTDSNTKDLSILIADQYIN